MSRWFGLSFREERGDDITRRASACRGVPGGGVLIGATDGVHRIEQCQHVRMVLRED